MENQELQHGPKTKTKHQMINTMTYWFTQTSKFDALHKLNTRSTFTISSTHV